MNRTDFCPSDVRPPPPTTNNSFSFICPRDVHWVPILNQVQKVYRWLAMNSPSPTQLWTPINVRFLISFLMSFFSLPLEWPQTYAVSMFNKDSHVSADPESWLGFCASWASYQWETACFLCVQLFAVLSPPIHTRRHTLVDCTGFKTLPYATSSVKPENTRQSQFLSVHVVQTSSTTG